MSTRLLTRFLPRLSSAFHLSCFSYPTARSTRCSPSLYSLLTTTSIPRFPPPATAVRSFATNLPKYCPTEDARGLDWEHWLVILFPNEGRGATRDQIIDTYIKTLAMFVGSEEEARMRIYSISTQHCYSFGYRGSVELANEIEAAKLPQVALVVPDAYQNPENQDYGGMAFHAINLSDVLNHFYLLVFTQ
ncbi:hypothetical protein Vadar_015813 [Vaccinium darrowii]|uniref:Uncharacterized protein n=1 Tax=Vaccinium darrowii TaxID=229202 RepID=A0ACB7XHT9_9ERIC|nr:hypothetical protein Vadar_015813 [Vaccinium darrowii]